MSKYGVFIIENLRGEDFFDGENLRKILNLSCIENVYREVHHKDDFADAIREFKASNLRYLHISCHADMEGIEINGEEIVNSELLGILMGNVRNRRVFFSSCKGGNRNTATAVNKAGGQSVIGTPIDLSFDKAALFWPAFYHVINCVESQKMNQKSISNTLKKCVDLFEIPINYYHGIKKEPKKLRRYKFRYNAKTSNSIITISKLT